ncbi:MAG: hypothetical protein U1C56_00175 [Candidatus Curtissbacteria bacterium]|nr:hypothetical protein [Candidatus Curtissbacteria bacterium]
MDPEEKDGQDKIKIGVIGVFLVGLFVLAVGLGLTFFKKPPSDEIQIISAQSSSPTSEI